MGSGTTTRVFRNRVLKGSWVEQHRTVVVGSQRGRVCSQ